jgi:glycosyltransferase involved in cell wall biosynthesis
MLVSIIIPVYNVESYIKDSLLSALNQTFESIEYIIVDDCGTDNSMVIAQEIIDVHPKREDIYIYHHEKNRGLSAARNTGLEKATGEFIFFMDSDDEITENCIELHYKKMIFENPDFVVSDVKVIGNLNPKEIVKQIKFDNIEKNEILKTFFLMEWPISAWNKLYRKSLIVENDIKFIEGLISEDYLWLYEISKKASKISVVHNKTYLYKLRANSITSSPQSHRKLDSQIYILNYILADWKNNFLPIEMKKVLYHFFLTRRFIMTYTLFRCPWNLSLKKKYYQEINSPEYRHFNNGIKGFILRSPFLLYYICLIFPYFFLRRIKKIVTRIVVKIRDK